jgi:glutamate synthase domain-containing protein 2
MEKIGWKVLWASIGLAVVVAALAFVSPWFLVLELIFVPLVLLGLYDITQRRHNITRNYPIAGHMRFLLESMGPELHQYLVESDENGRPFNRDVRSLIYSRAKNVEDKKPFGTELDVYAAGYMWLTHSISTRPMIEEPEKNLRTTIGGPQCKQPYDSSILNISAMSFGALGAPAILAMNTGARMGGFAHDTGEGGISPYHREPGGDLIWQIGTGYFGCRTEAGDFSPELFTERATDPQVKMIEIKLSQGAKPGHGGILPGAKVTQEIADTRLVPVGKDVFSPTYHKAFSTPRELCAFIAQLRELSGGKPVGFKICIGDPREFMAIVKAMIETGTIADFIVVDGGEGGTGAAPLEFSNAMGSPLLEGLLLVHGTLVGAGLREQVRIGASGKMVTAGAITGVLALGADLCNSARAFMMSVGCIQAQRCHTNRCPVGVTTQDKKLQRALDVPDKSQRVHHFHKNTVHAVAEMVAAMGLDHPTELRPEMVYGRSGGRVMTFAEMYEFPAAGDLLAGTAAKQLQGYWDAASVDSFRPQAATAAHVA